MVTNWRAALQADQTGRSLKQSPNAVFDGPHWRQSRYVEYSKCDVREKPSRWTNCANHIAIQQVVARCNSDAYMRIERAGKRWFYRSRIDR
jgi:hypothetical protein